MKILYRLLVNSIIFILTFLILILSINVNVKSLSKIVDKIEIIDIVGLKIVKQENDLGYKLCGIPENINIIEARVVNKNDVYKFSDNVLLDLSGNVVNNLEEENYTLVLNTKQLGEIYKMINKTDCGYKVLDIKVTYSKYKNSLEISNDLLENSQVTIFKKDVEILNTKLDSEGKASVSINDIQNLTSSTYTVLVKKDSEIVGIDYFYMNPIQKDLNLKGTVNFNMVSEDSNKLNISIKAESGITLNDRVQIVRVYDEENPNENLLLNLDCNKISNFNGEVVLKNILSKDKKYKARLMINDVELDSQYDCDVHIKDLDIPKIKITTVEKIGKELKATLSEICDLKEDIFDKNFVFIGDTLNVIVNNGICLKGVSAKTKISSNEVEVCFKNVCSINDDDLIEVESIFDLNHEDLNLIDKNHESKIINKTGVVYLKTEILNNCSYGMKIKINGVKISDIIPISVDFQNVSSYFTNENKLFLNLEPIGVLNSDKIEILSLKCVDDSQDIISEKITDLSLNNNELMIPLNVSLKDGGKYLISINLIREGVSRNFILEFNNKLKKIDENKRSVDLNLIEFGDGYFKFEHNLHKSMKFNKIICDFEGVKTKIDDKYIFVYNLIPYKKYKNLKIQIKNDKTLLVEFEIPEFNCKESEDEIKNFISKTYIKLKNGLSVDENNFEFGNEIEFWFWYNRIKKGEVSLRNFVLNVIDENKFSQKYSDNSEKIKILYNIIFGINPSEQSFNIWINDFNKILKEEKLEKAIKIIAEKMFTNLKFKSLEKQLK